MQREKLTPELKQAAKKYALAQNEARDKTNAANRIKTELRNTIKAYWMEHKLPIGSYIRSDGMEFRYEANESVSLDADAVLKMYENNEITREQFLRMVSIAKGEAKNVLGADVVADLEVTTVGDKMDVRIESLPVENIDDEYIAVRRLVRKKIKRSVFGKNEEKSLQSIAKPVRRIKTRSVK